MIQIAIIQTGNAVFVASSHDQHAMQPSILFDALQTKIRINFRSYYSALGRFGEDLGSARCGAYAQDFRNDANVLHGSV